MVIIDPSPDLLEALAHLIRGRGWGVRTASSLAKASALIDAFEPHVVLAGVERPMEIGVSFAQRVRQLHDGHVLLMAMSASPPPDVRAQDAGVFDLICHKPVMEGGVDAIERKAAERFPSLLSEPT